MGNIDDSVDLNADKKFSVFDEAMFEQAVIQHLQTLGYEWLYGPNVKRTNESYRDILLPGVLEDCLRRINPKAHSAALAEALRKISDIEGVDLLTRNIQFMDYLQSGVEVSFFDGEKTDTDHIRIVDFEHPERNVFNVVNQWTYVEYEEKRPDVIVFVNGMPLVVFELKSPSRENVDASDAYLQLRNYMQVIPSLFAYNAFCVMTDMSDTRVGTITASEDRFMQWKTADGDYSKIANKIAIRWTTLLDGMFPKERLLDILRNFICFSKSEEGTAKILAAYHQYFGVHKAVDSTLHAMNSDGKAGVFWHTQGSGKSLSMVFYAHLLAEQVSSPTIVVTTDRTDLDGQLYSQFAKCADFLRQTPQQAADRKSVV